MLFIQKNNILCFIKKLVFLLLFFCFTFICVSQNLTQTKQIESLFAIPNTNSQQVINLSNYFSADGSISYQLKKVSAGITPILNGSNIEVSTLEGFFGKSFIELTVTSASEDLTQTIEVIVQPTTIKSNELQVRVLILNFDPTITSSGNSLSTHKGWSNPYTLAEGYMKEIYASSGNKLRYTVSDWKNVNEFPIKNDDFQYNETTYLDCIDNGNGCHSPDRVDYLQLIADNNIDQLINNNEIDEVWLFGGPYFGFFESAMTGPGNFWVNGIINGNTTAERPYVIMGFNYQRQVAQMLHNLNHRTESTLQRFYGSWNRVNPVTNWDKFSTSTTFLAQGGSTVKPGVGSCHHPHNANADYDYGNILAIETTAEDWINYPNLIRATTSISSTAWGGNEIGYQKWWFSHLPKADGINVDGRENNWWKYLFDFSNYNISGTSINTNFTDSGTSININLPKNFGTYTHVDLDQVFTNNDISKLQYKLQEINGSINNGVNAILEGSKIVLHSVEDFLGQVTFKLEIFDRDVISNRTFTVTIQETGCKDVNSCNYNPAAVFDDGSCTYPPTLNLTETATNCDGNSVVIGDLSSNAESFCWNSLNNPVSATWKNIGTYGFSTGQAGFTSLTYLDDIPYVAYADGNKSNKATVKKFDGANWVTIGIEGFTTNSVNSLSISSSSTSPYIAFKDIANQGKASVMKFNGTNWEYVGNAGFSDGAIFYPSFFINNDIPYLAYQDNANANKATVKKFNGTTWETVGNVGFSSGTADHLGLSFFNGEPYVVYRDWDNGFKSSVMKYNGSQWVYIGNAGFSTGFMEQSTIAFDTNGIPYVAFNDWSNSNKATVMKYSEGNWETVGSVGFSEGTVNYLSLKITETAPFLAYKDSGNSNKAVVKKFNGVDWINTGNSSISEGEANYISLEIHNSSIYLVFSDSQISNKIAMKKLGNACLGTNNTISVSTPDTYTLTANGASGCSITKNIIVTNGLSSTSSFTVKTTGENYFWNGINRNTNGIHNWTGTNLSGCDSIATLNLTTKYVHPEFEQLAINSSNSVIVESGTALYVNNNITVIGSGELIVNSDATKSGSLLVTGTVTGNITYNRHIDDTDWHLVAAPVTTQNIPTFVGNTNNAIATSGNKFAVSYYKNSNTAGSRWTYHSSSPSGENEEALTNFTSGLGYATNRTSAGDFSFIGQMATSDVILTLNTASGTHYWHSVGNPYPAFLPGNNNADATNVLGQNITALDPSFAALYIWNGSAYDPINHDSAALRLAPGQAFMVKAKDNSEPFTFSKASQFHYDAANTFYKGSNANRPQVDIELTSGNLNSKTRIKFASFATLGLDVGYDAGTYQDATPTFSIDTHLVDNSQGIDFTLQYLPDSDYESFRIPLSIRAQANQSIIFSANISNLPDGMDAYLEDTHKNTIHKINGTNHTLNLTTKSEGVGRFYVRLSPKTLSLEDLSLSDVTIYNTTKENLRITGLQGQGNADIQIFDITGRKLLNTKFQSKNINDITLPENIKSGIYIVKISTNDKTVTKKLILK